MARTPLSEEEKNRRAAEKAELLSTRKKYNTKTSQNPPVTNMETKPNEPATTTTPGEEQSQTNPAPSSGVQNTANESVENTGDQTQNGEFGPDSKFAPMGGNKIKRGYSAPVVDPNMVNTVIPEANIIVESNTEAQVKSLTTPTGEIKQDPILPPAEGFNQLSKPEQTEAAKQTVELFLGAYDRLHWLGRKFITVDMDDLADEHRKGDINMHAKVFEDEDDPQNDISVKDYFDDFNQQVEKEFVVTEQFKETVRPPLERICAKRGWGASDEMFVAFKFGEDIAMKTGILIGFKKLTNKYMTEFREDHAKIQQRVQAELKKERDRESAKERLLEEAKLKIQAERDAKAEAEAKAKAEAEAKDKAIVTPGSAM